MPGNGKGISRVKYSKQQAQQVLEDWKWESDWHVEKHQESQCGLRKVNQGARVLALRDRGDQEQVVESLLEGAKHRIFPIWFLSVGIHLPV